MSFDTALEARLALQALLDMRLTTVCVQENAHREISDIQLVFVDNTGVKRTIVLHSEEEINIEIIQAI